MNRKHRTRSFHYASVDFLLNEDGIPVFMEVNDNTLAPYYIDQKSMLTDKLISTGATFRNLNHNHKDDFIACFNSISSNAPNKELAIICKRRNQPDSIKCEISYLIQLFRSYGYNASMYFPEDFIIEDGLVIVKKEKIVPSIIFRRNFSFPPAEVRQIVVNNLNVHTIASDKYETHQIIRKTIEKNALEIQQPETFLIKDDNDLTMVLSQIQNSSNDYIAKPNSSYGGNGLLYLKNASPERIMSVISQALLEGNSYLVQERIKPALFKSDNLSNYYFDIRVMVYGGYFAGIEGRRSNVPYLSENISEQSLITNINSGGLDILVVGTDHPNEGYTFEKTRLKQLCTNINFTIDSNVLVLGNSFFTQLKQAAEEIVLSIDQEIGGSYGE